MFEALIPKRTPEDFASGVIRVRLGRRDIVLEELPMEAMDAWSAQVDQQLAVLLRDLDAGEDTNSVLVALAQAKEDAIAALVLYPGIPDEAYLRRNATNSQVLRALMGVWSAANPLVAAFVEALMVFSQPTATGNASELMNTLQRISDGRSARSARNSPTANSSSASTPVTSATASATQPTSKRHGSARSSPATRVRTDDGAALPIEALAAAARSAARRSSVPS